MANAWGEASDRTIRRVSPNARFCQLIGAEQSGRKTNFLCDFQGTI